LGIQDLPGTEQSAPQSRLVEMSWDPITRIVGSLGIYTKIDFNAKKVAECHSTSSIFRGYSIFMKGKDPRDAHFITSRICGICGDNHMVCSGTVATNQLFTDYYSRLMRYIEYMKICVPLHDDLFDSMLEALPGYEHVGERRILLVCWGRSKTPITATSNMRT
jgi:hypothetical protein